MLRIAEKKKCMSKGTAVHQELWLWKGGLGYRDKLVIK